MKKEDITLALVLLELIVLVMLIYNISFSDTVSIVIKEETQLNLMNENVYSVCPELCEERGYHGWQGSGGVIPPDMIACDCYWLVQDFPRQRIEED